MVQAQVMLFGNLLVGDFWIGWRGGRGNVLFIGIFDGGVGFVGNGQCFQISSSLVARRLEQVAVFSPGPERYVPFFASIFDPKGVRGVFDSHEGHPA